MRRRKGAWKLSSELFMRARDCHMYTVAVLGNNIWGDWPLIIWEATTAKRNYNRTKKHWGGGCAPWPQHRTATAYTDNRDAPMLALLSQWRST